MVTHHVEEIPAGFTHALVLKDGRVHAAGLISSTLSSEVLSSAFGVPITVSRVAGRFAARGD
jgi:iron complex transport system ATP-binding protein